MKNFAIIIVVIFSLAALTFAANEFQIFGTKFWGVRKENAKREVFEQSQSYVEGKRQSLIKYHHEWIKSSSEDKTALEALIRAEFANFDESKIEQPELRSFLSNIKYN